jgi:hypothetical protein
MRRASSSTADFAIANGDTMSVAAQIVDDLLRSGERAFGIDNPFNVTERSRIAGESCRFAQAGECAEELPPVAVERRLQEFQEQAPV